MHVNVRMVLKKGDFVNKIEQFYMSMRRQILGFSKCTNNIKVLSELGKTPLRVDIEARLFKCLQRLSFIEIDMYLKPLEMKNWIKKAGFKIQERPFANALNIRKFHRKTLAGVSF